MNPFWENLTSTLIGTIAGFIFSIALFYLTEWIKDRQARRSIIEGLRREFEYNVSLLNTFHSAINKTIGKITAGDKQAFYQIQYSRYSKLFLNQAFNAGMLYKRLNNEELAELDHVYRFYDLGSELYVNGMVNQWKSGTGNATETLNILEFNRDSIEQHQKALERITNKL